MKDKLKNINIANIVSQIPTLKKRILKSEAFKIALPIFLGIIILLLILPILFDNSYLKFQIAQKFSKIAGINLVVKGDVKVRLLPSPKIVMEDIILQNHRSNNSKRVFNFHAKSITAKISLYNSKISKITLINPILESHFDNDKITDRPNKLSTIIKDLNQNPTIEEKSLNPGFSSKLFSIEDINSEQFSAKDFPEVEITNGHLIIYDEREKLKEVKSINITTNIKTEKISTEGSFTSENITSNFDGLAKFNIDSKKPKSYFHLISPITEFHVTGNFTGPNNGFIKSNFNGSIAGEIQELKTFYKTYISNSDIIFHKMKYNNMSIKLSADLENKNGEINFDKILLKSELINGEGNINSNFAQKIPLIDINFALENLNLDAILSKDPISIHVPRTIKSEIENLPDDTVGAIIEDPKNKKEITNSTIISEDKKETKSTIKFNLTNKIKDFDLTAEIEIKDTKYLGGTVKDTNIYLTVSNSGKIVILPMVFHIPGEGTFRMNGAFDNSFGVPKFIGEFDARGENLEDLFKWLKIESQNLKFDHLKQYEARSDVMMLPNETNLNNLYLNLNEGDSELLGKIKVNSSKTIPQISINFQINKFNIDNYFLTSGQNIYLSPGSLLRKMLWLNDHASNNEISVAFDNLIYKGESFPEQSLTLKFRRGYLEISNLNLNSDKTKLNADLILDISNSDPRFYLKIDADKFHYQSQIQENGKLVTVKQNFIDQFFALPSLDGFNGKIDLSFDDINIDNLNIENAKLLGTLSNGTVPDATISADIFGGNLNYQGSLGIKLNKTINGSLSLTKAELQTLLANLFKIDNISGLINISASITSAANNSKEFYSKLMSNVKFSSNTPTISGYGLSDLIRKMSLSQYYAKDLGQPENILNNPDAVTIFTQATGSIKLYGAKDGKIEAKIKAPAMNGVLSGTLNLANKNTNMLFNSIFLTGTRQNHVPINIATNIGGRIDNLSYSSNIDQVRQYLGLPKIHSSYVEEPKDNSKIITKTPQKEHLKNKNLIQEIPIQ